jgi:ABC-type molybdenum transport system ATPase subunit/photorepair protein PhrA
MKMGFIFIFLDIVYFFCYCRLMAELLLDCRDLSFGYDGRTVLGGLGFSVEEGDKLCVVGENGSGKSTLL